MNNQWVLTLTALVVAASSAAAGEDADEKIELKSGDRILFFGDSLTFLAGREEPKKYVTNGYVRIVKETLDTTHKGKHIEVDWVATGGHTVPDLLKRLDKDVLPKKPTIVVIQIGCNDARRIPAETFRSSLSIRSWRACSPLPVQPADDVESPT